jgi:hypothetical protein
MMQVGCGLGITNRRTVSDECRRRLREENRRLGLRVTTHLGNVIGIVSADAINAVYGKTRG